jgi:hypothetical protein
MIDLLAAAALTPWAHPLVFRPLPGWRTGSSGNISSLYGPSSVRAPKASSAWIARNVRYRDKATEDPPNKTLQDLPSRGVIVWAVIFQSNYTPHKPIRLDLTQARHLPCCEGAYVAGGVDELTGSGPRRAYSVIVRVFFGSRPTRARRAEAQRALRRWSYRHSVSDAGCSVGSQYARETC